MSRRMMYDDDLLAQHTHIYIHPHIIIHTRRKVLAARSYAASESTFPTRRRIHITTYKT